MRFQGAVNRDVTQLNLAPLHLILLGILPQAVNLRPDDLHGQVFGFFETARRSRS